MSQFLSLSFWFDIYPLPLATVVFWILAAVFILAIGLGILGLIIKKKKNLPGWSKKSWLKLTHFGFSFGIVGFILVFFKQQMIPYLGMRIWLFAWLIICFAWLVFILKYIILEIPKLKKEKEEQEQLLKYIP